MPTKTVPLTTAQRIEMYEKIAVISEKEYEETVDTSIYQNSYKPRPSNLVSYLGGQTPDAIDMIVNLTNDGISVSEAVWIVDGAINE